MIRKKTGEILIRAAMLILVVLMVILVKLPVTTTNDSEGEYIPVFNDVSAELRPYVELVYKRGIVGSSGGGDFGVDDKITINELAYIADALYEEIHNIERTHTWYNPEIDEYIATAEKYGIWHDFGRDKLEYVTRDDVAAVFGHYVDDTYTVYADIKQYRGMEKSADSGSVIKLYNTGVTLDSNINTAYSTEISATREDITRLVCMIINPLNRLTHLKKSYTLLQEILSSKMAMYEGDWSLYFKDTDTDEVISINSHQVYSASLIKLFVIQAVYTRINEGTLSDSAQTEELLRRMITWSDNEAWQTLARMLGGGTYSTGMEYTTKVAHDAGFSETGTYYQGDKDNFNFTSVNDCGAYLDMLLKGQIVNEEYSSKILGLMKQQQVRHKIPAGIPEGVEVANKTGELEYVQGDAAIVYSPSCTYILVIIADDLTDTNKACERIANMSAEIYDYVNE